MSQSDSTTGSLQLAHWHNVWEDVGNIDIVWNRNITYWQTLMIFVLNIARHVQCQYLNYSPGFKLRHRYSTPVIPTYEDYISWTPPSPKKFVFPDFKTFHNKISNYFTVCWMFCCYFLVHPIAEKDVNNYRIFNVEWQLVLTKIISTITDLSLKLDWKLFCFLT